MMTGKLINKVTDWWEDNLRSLLGRLTPDRRVILIVIMLITFSGLSIFMTFSSIYNLGKEKGEKMKVDHIERLQFELKIIQHKTDSLKLQKNFHYDRK
jgi:FtsZ-binding cell division protein ZapB